MPQLALTIATIILAAPPQGLPKLPTSLDLEQVRSIVVQHGGRWPPLDTVARDRVESVTGKMFFGGHDPVALLLAWTFDGATWKDAPLIEISNAELRGHLELPEDQTVFSYAELIGHRRLRQLIDELAHIEKGRKPDPLESKVSDINGQLLELQEVFSGRTIKPIPAAEDLLAPWKPIPGAKHDHEGEHQHDEPVVQAWSALGLAFLKDDRAAFSAAADELTRALGALPAARRPDPKLIATELRFNRLRPFRTAWMVMIFGVVLAALAMVIRRKAFDALAVVGLIAGFALLTYGLSLRWQIAGRIPAANMFESLLFLSWGMGAFAILAMIFLRYRIIPLTASAMGALALVLADVLPLDGFIRPITPVLMDTYWMSIHVPVIMVSYSVLALGVLFAHVELVALAVAPRRSAAAKTIDALHYWYIHVGTILLLAGIVTGSMWAASSWGRYWGWDPKEVWSLVAFLGYLAILHVRIDHERIPSWAYAVSAVLAVALFGLVVPMLAPITIYKGLALTATALAMVLFVLARGQLATALKSIVAFWLIVMTYVGVNFVLGSGLHSYGFGTGAVVNYMFLIGGIDLGLMILCSLVYLARRPSPSDSPPSAVPA